MRNLRNLSDSIKSQKLNYEFPYSAFELEMEAGFLVISEGRGLIPVSPAVIACPRYVTDALSRADGRCRLDSAKSMERNQSERRISTAVTFRVEIESMEVVSSRDEQE